MCKKHAKGINRQIRQIAFDHLFVDTLRTRNNVELDFHEVGVWAIKSALLAAYQAGFRAAARDAKK